jgi:hypothetical protein
MPVVEILREKYSYDPDTGVVLHKLTSKPVAGRCKRGYGRVRVDGKYYRLHRVIWVIMTGEDPGEQLVDHINGNPRDNTWSNLRLATKQENQQNRRGWGITRDKRRISKPWRAQIRHEGRLEMLGTFACPLMARMTYIDRSREIRGEFSPV